MKTVKSPWAGRDRNAEREEKREAVLHAAAEAFAERGYHRTSLDDIAARLGITKPTLYYYARNKDDLVSAVATRALDRILEAIEGDRESTALAQLQHLLRHYAEVMATDFGRCIIVVLDAHIGGPGGDLMQRGMRQIDARMRELLALGTEDGSIARGDPKLTAFMIAGALNGIARWFDEGGALSAAMVAEKFVNQLTAGLAPRR
ncbi:TetR/AcrR family transcriptional regulator [Sphingomonas chungangi]|nr:TetR/AcrR family transcriptional regulator [Sphingomonas chungangi]